MKKKCFIVLLLFTSCGGRGELNVSYSDKEIQVIKKNYFTITHIFQKIKTRSDIPFDKLGYTIGKTSYYHHCSELNGEMYIYKDFTTCNYSQYLSDQEEELLSTAITSLKQLYIYSCVYEESSGGFFLRLVVKNDSSYENSRYLFICEKEPIINLGIYEVLDKKSNVYLLKIARH